MTGAGGFIGGAIVRRLLSADRYAYVAVASRKQLEFSSKRVLPRFTAELTPKSDLTTALEGVSVVIHCAARVHKRSEKGPNLLTHYRRANVDTTLNLARQAAASGARRFIYISSIKVNGEFSQLGTPFSSQDLPAPSSFYGISKMEAEDGLRLVAKTTGMELTIIRPPLVYGPGAKANFASLLRWLHSGLPLPLGAVSNLRSLVSTDNLVDLIRVCISHPCAANQTFLVSDGHDISTTELILRLGEAIGSRSRLISIPVPFLELMASSVGKSAMAKSLCASLQVDQSHTLSSLDWYPPVSLDTGLQIAASSFCPED